MTAGCVQHPEGKYVVDIDKDIDVAKLTTGARVALRNDSYTLHLVLPTKVCSALLCLGLHQGRALSLYFILPAKYGYYEP